MSEPSFLESLNNWVTGGVAALVAWVWNSTHKKIADQEAKIEHLQMQLHTKVVRKEDFDIYVDRTDASRKELHDSVNTVSSKVDQILVMLANQANHRKDS